MTARPAEGARDDPAVHRNGQPRLERGPLSRRLVRCLLPVGDTRDPERQLGHARGSMAAPVTARMLIGTRCIQQRLLPLRASARHPPRRTAHRPDRPHRQQLAGRGRTPHRVLDLQHALHGGRFRQARFSGQHTLPFGSARPVRRGSILGAPCAGVRLQATPRTQPIVAVRRWRHRPTPLTLPLGAATRRAHAAATLRSSPAPRRGLWFRPAPRAWLAGHAPAAAPRSA